MIQFYCVFYIILENFFDIHKLLYTFLAYNIPVLLSFSGELSSTTVTVDNFDSTDALFSVSSSQMKISFSSSWLDAVNFFWCRCCPLQACFWCCAQYRRRTCLRQNWRCWFFIVFPWFIYKDLHRKRMFLCVSRRNKGILSMTIFIHLIPKTWSWCIWLNV